MAIELRLLWCLAIAGYVLGVVVHAQQAVYYWRYQPRAHHPTVVAGWLFDEANRAAAKTLLAIWGFARLALIATRVPDTTGSSLVRDLDLLTLALYWALLLLFTHWTWRVRRARAREDTV